MSSAIEVLKTMLEIRKKPNLFVSECCKDPFEDRKIAEANALGEAIVALEKLEKISFILETRIEDVEENIDCLEQELKTLGKEDEIIETELTACQDHLEDLKEIEKELGGKK